MPVIYACHVKIDIYYFRKDMIKNLPYTPIMYTLLLTLFNILLGLFTLTFDFVFIVMIVFLFAICLVLFVNLIQSIIDECK